MSTDVLPGPSANCPYAFPPKPTIRGYTLVPIIGTGMDVVIDFMCLSRICSRRSGCCRSVKDEEDTSEVDKDSAEHCNVSGEATCAVLVALAGKDIFWIKLIEVDRLGLKECEDSEEEL